MKWDGVMPAITTKFNNNGELDFELFSSHFLYLKNSGVHAMILGGTLGEASVLNIEEKEQLIKLSLELSDNEIPIILNIAEGSTHEAIKQAMFAEKIGVQGLMALPPMRYKADDREIFQFFSDIANNTSLPIMIYNNPVDYKNEVTLDVFEKLIDKHDNIQAVKESTRDISNVSRIKARFKDRLKILCGVDTLAAEELCMGADGWVAGLVNAFPYETMTVFNLIKNNRVEEALEIYRWFLPLLELDIHPKLVQYIKLAEAKVGVGSEYVRPPRLVLEGEERLKIENIILKGIESKPDLSKYKV
jgi:4-hydroxy-tetrahydrodipicolinate synthase